MKIAFKYKLSLSISLIVTGVLTEVFLFLQADIKKMPWSGSRNS